MAQTSNFVALSLICCFTTALFAEIHARHHHHHSVKLFVFGDSYADTGNHRKMLPGPWKEPYGITYPGKPAGRFSDGRVLTDYIASYFGIKVPIPYKWRRSVDTSQLQYGMNFAYGGTGVFNTLVDEPNMTTQVNFFQTVLEQKVYSKQDLNSSIALVSIAGNDYATYLVKNGNNAQDLTALTKSIIEQLAVNLKRILGLGVQKIAVTTMEPMGCLPQVTVYSSYQNCSESLNSAAQFHNQVLDTQVQKLNNESKKPVIFTLDLYSAFMAALETEENDSGNSELKMSLQPCCVGVDNHYCGNVDEKGEKKYTVCENPELSFFWDTIHPAQNGWHSVYSALRPSLLQLRLTN